MTSQIPEEDFLERIAGAVELPCEQLTAPSRLKSQIYSILTLRQATTGPLASLTQTRAAGYGLCIFEELVRIAPAGERVDWRTTIHMLVQRQFLNPCAIDLRFEEVVGLRLVPPQPDCEDIISGAAFFVRDGIYYWAQDGNWTPESADDRTTWVAARRGLLEGRKRLDWPMP